MVRDLDETRRPESVATRPSPAGLRRAPGADTVRVVRLLAILEQGTPSLPSARPLEATFRRQQERWAASPPAEDAVSPQAVPGGPWSPCPSARRRPVPRSWSCRGQSAFCAVRHRLPRGSVGQPGDGDRTVTPDPLSSSQPRTGLVIRLQLEEVGGAMDATLRQGAASAGIGRHGSTAAGFYTPTGSLLLGGRESHPLLMEAAAEALAFLVDGHYHPATPLRRWEI